MSRLATAVIGLGAMGRHHARLLAAHPEADLVACCDSDAERAAAIAAERGGEAITSAAELPERLDAVVVSTPTSSHLEIAEPLLRRGVACLVEKPIAASLDEADALLAAAEAGGAVLAVGHAERFNPGLLQVRELLSDPIFVECHRLGVFPDRSLDVDVVLDLMVHDLDLLRWISQSELEEVAAIGVNVVTPRVDIANARLVFGSGLTANLTCSRVSA
ncbi:MAG: Gfo/Idh/MocA family oxidoreductase, partial [Acidobacteriota bacterium]